MRAVTLLCVGERAGRIGLLLSLPQDPMREIFISLHTLDSGSKTV